MGKVNLISLEVENVKKIKAVKLIPDPASPLVVIAGDNNAGKSSFIDAIEYAMCGERAIPDKPVRDGATSAKIILDLDAYVVKRHWPKGEKSYLSVTTKDGDKIANAQQLLDRLKGDLSFDPLDFAKASGKEQQAILLKIAGVDLTALDDKYKETYDQRRIEGRVLSDLAGDLAGIAIPEEGLPEAEIDISALNLKYKEAVEQKEANDRKRRELKDAGYQVLDAREEVERFKQELKDAEKALADKEKTFADREPLVQALIYPDVVAIYQETEKATGLNIDIREGIRYRDARVKHDKQDNRHKGLTKDLADIDKNKADTLKAAKLPVKLLAIDAEGVKFNGLPFDQECTSSQIKVSLEIAMALNPTLKFIRMKEGSLLDENTIKAIETTAGIKGYHIWIERVGKDDKLATLIIEDGEALTIGGK